MTNKNDSAKPASSNPATGPALYELGTLGDGTIIVRQRNGSNEGVLVARDGTQIRLTQEGRFKT